MNRELGRHGAQIDGLEARMARVETKLDRVLAVLSEARGGWKTLILVGAIAGAVGAGLGKIAAVFGWLPK